METRKKDTGAFTGIIHGLWMAAVVWLVLAIITRCAFAGWSDDWTVNGVRADQITCRGVAEIAAGMLTSTAMHWAGHIIAFEVTGTSWRQEGLYEANNEESRSNIAWHGRSGFIAQLFGGTALRYTRFCDSFFALGYNLNSAVEIITYPVRFQGVGDLESIGRDGSPEIEYGIYSVWSLWLLSDRKEDEQ